MMRRKIEKIQETAFNFFNDYSNLDYNSKGFGLTVDHTNDLEKASIAATGFTLSSYIIADKYGYLAHEELIKRVIGTLKTLYYNVPQYEGFFAHFVDMKTAERKNKSEYSTVDTALALNGVIACMQYFKNEEIDKYSKLIINRVNWKHFVHKRNGKDTLYMAYNDLKDGDYAEGKSGFIHHWGMFAEQLMMYVMAAAKNDFSIEEARSLYNGFDRIKGSYDSYEFIFSPGNTLFIYQYPLAWLDLENVYDLDNISWFLNAKNACMAQYKWCMDNKERYKTYNPNFFGLTASDSPNGYAVFHALPNDRDLIITDGTVAANAIIGSLPFITEIALKGIKDMFNIDGLWNSKYGFYDAFNFEKDKWISNRYIAIDKGLEMLMANAYLTKDVQTAYMNSSIIIEGMRKLGWEKRIGGKTR